jgi:drug/metabolite transporter (DMT)-like permease
LLWEYAAAVGKNQLLGDMLCLGGAVLFAVVSVAQDLMVKTQDWVEYLGMVGLLGSILSIVQTYVLMWWYYRTDLCVQNIRWRALRIKFAV